MKKNKINNQPKIQGEFKIPQIPKIEGLRVSTKYKKQPFVSPLFGTNVKDEVTPPFIVRAMGDKVKSYDAFRTNPKMNQEEKKDYYEFTNIINDQTRKDVFGVDSYQKEKPSQTVTNHEQPPMPKVVDKPIDEEPTNGNPNIPIWMRQPKVASQLSPEESETPVVTHQRNEDVQPRIVPKESNHQNEIPKVKDTSTKLTFDYRLPTVSFFKKTVRNPEEKPQWLLDQIEVIDKTFKDHAVEAFVYASKKGPTVTRYEIQLEPGVNVKRVQSLQDNLMMNLAATSLRIEAPIPGKPYVGIEVPNKVADIVSFGNVVDTKAFLEDHDHPLKVALGENIDGENIYVDIAKMPHGLIAGATNSGKSVCVNTILVSLLLKNTPEDLKLILIDPKMVELTPYNDLPHLITPVITDAKMAAAALNWVVDEMEKRYRTFAGSRSRDITSYNQNVAKGFISEDKMPYIIIIIDELADLMMVAAHDVEDAIQRITQKARAAGIHLLVATQRPTTDVVKGTIKSNIPTRIAFRVASFVDSTTILDGQGAETLLGRGDMLLKEGDRAVRLQGAYIQDHEIYDVVDFIKDQRGPSYVFKHDDLKRTVERKDEEMDDLFEDVAYYVVRENVASINQISKEFNLGFNRAQKIVVLLENYGIVSESTGTKARDVLVDEGELEQILAQARGVL